MSWFDGLFLVKLSSLSLSVDQTIPLEIPRPLHRETTTTLSQFGKNHDSTPPSLLASSLSLRLACCTVGLNRSIKISQKEIRPILPFSPSLWHHYSVFCVWPKTLGNIAPHRANPIWLSSCIPCRSPRSPWTRGYICRSRIPWFVLPHAVAFDFPPFAQESLLCALMLDEYHRSTEMSMIRLAACYGCP